MHFYQIGLDLLLALLIWQYYRSKKVSPFERYHTFAPRFWTGSIDTCVLWPVTFITTSLLSLHLSKIATACILVVQSMAWIVYTIFMHGRYGQTVGKMVTKVRIVDFKTEQPITWRQALLREGIPSVLSLLMVVYALYFLLRGQKLPANISDEGYIKFETFSPVFVLPLLWFLAEVLTMLTNEKCRALHDLIAGTVVIRTNTVEIPGITGESASGPAPVPSEG